MTSFFSRLGITTIVAALYLIIFPTAAGAFSISPPIIELDANPGDMIRTSIRIQNTSFEKKYYVFTVQKFIPKGELGQQEFLPPSETSGLPEWLYFDRSVLELESGEAMELPIMIRVPSNAKSGGHYAAVLFSEQTELAQGAVGIVPRTGSLVLLTVGGNLLRSYSIDQFHFTPEHPSHLPVEFNTVLSNTGNTHFQPEGSIRIKNMFGNTVASYPLNPTKSRLLPASKRSFQTIWDKPAEQATGPLADLVNEWRNFGLGKYTAELTIRLGSEDRVQTIEIWIWPWRSLLLLGLVILCAISFSVGRKVFKS